MKRKFDVKLRKVGNSFVVTIPADFVERFNVEEGDFLAVELDSGEIKKINEKRGKNAKHRNSWSDGKRQGNSRRISF